jgi:hypothetical protein
MLLSSSRVLYGSHTQLLCSEEVGCCLFRTGEGVTWVCCLLSVQFKLCRVGDGGGVVMLGCCGRLLRRLIRYVGGVLIGFFWYTVTCSIQCFALYHYTTM